MDANTTAKQARAGLVLTAGGARAAYQAGVVKGISDILGDTGKRFPFPVLSGVSAGAINCGLLGSLRGTFANAAEYLYWLWSQIHSEQVMRTDVSSLTVLGARWLRDLSLGGLFGGGQSTFLIDSAPLKEFLSDKINFEAVYENLSEGRLYSFGITATSYLTGTAITFFDGNSQLQPWERNSRIGKRERLTLDHVLASASIPILFPPVKIENAFFGDGGIRLSAPLSPAIHMGAEKILVIGIRHERARGETTQINRDAEMAHVSLADIAGEMLNAAFFDTLDSDIERLRRINQTMALLSETQRSQHPQSLRPIPLLVIRPSEDLGKMASEQFRHFPRMLRYLLKGIGASGERGWDFLSYLAFDPAYTVRLLELGYQDALNQRDEIAEFLRE